MELYLQFGHGMIALSKELIKTWNGGTVILSPRDLTLEQMSNFSAAIKVDGGKVVIDPQFYLPKSDHCRLTAHSYWPIDYQTALFDRTSIISMLHDLNSNYNVALSSDFFILPGLLTSVFDENWYNYNYLILNEASKIIQDKEIYCTISLSKEAMGSEDQIQNVLEYLDTLEVDGCYIVAEPPANQYLISDPNWLVNLLDLTTGIKLQNKKVIVGYCQHQMLSLALSKVDAIASGTWLNVRSFNQGRFQSPTDEISRRSKWYYSPQALSEYQIPFLDLANRIGVIDILATNSIYGSTSSNLLFSGIQPSTVKYGERDSFKHYLQCLKYQCIDSAKPTYRLTIENLKIQIETARILTESLNAKGIIGRDRDFVNVADITLSAINIYDSLRGMVQGHNW